VDLAKGKQWLYPTTEWQSVSAHAIGDRFRPAMREVYYLVVKR
jgi:hypothetical protein